MSGKDSAEEKEESMLSRFKVTVGIWLMMIYDYIGVVGRVQHHADCTPDKHEKILDSVLWSSRLLRIVYIWA